MAKEEGTRACAMLSGNDHNSYVHNSTYQKSKYDLMKVMIEEAIRERLDVSSVKTAITIVDLGCSVGPNTFYTVQHIIDAICAAQKNSSSGQARAYEFQVFLNDQITNDFNMLFSTTPPDRRYFVAASPGSFYDRILSRDSVHFFHSTMALHWLSRSPPGVINKGRVEMYGGGPAILDAYMAQFRDDMAAFLWARAEELVDGGLMALLFQCRLEEMDLTKTKLSWTARYLEPILRELALEGKIKEEVLDSFQIPLYFPSVKEFEEMVEMNGQYTIHVAKVLDQRGMVEGCGEDASDQDPETLVMSISRTMRAAMEPLVSAHFGDDKVVEEVFLRLPAKLHQRLVTSDPFTPPPMAAFILQRKARNF